jgi:hypothetical protein
MEELMKYLVLRRVIESEVVQGMIPYMVTKEMTELEAVVEMI